MASPMPPAAMMQSGPPAAPPELPTLSAMPQGQTSAPPMPGQVGAFPELFFNIEQQIKLLAKALPPQMVSELDQIAMSLRAVLVKALQSGANSSSGSTMGLEAQPSMAGPVGPRPENF